MNQNCMKELVLLKTVNIKIIYENRLVTTLSKLLIHTVQLIIRLKWRQI